jgi:hypothetical protein
MLISIFSVYEGICQQTTGFSLDMRKDKPNDLSQRFITDYSGGRTSQVNLFNDIDLSVYELAAANFSFTDKDQVQKINFQPFKLLDKSNNLLNSIKLNVAQKKDITTFGIGFGGDYSDPFSNRGSRILDEVYNYHASLPRPIVADTLKFSKLRDSINNTNNTNEMKKILIVTLVDIPSAKIIEKAKQDNDKQNQEFKKNILDSLLLKYDERRAHHVIKWTVGFNTQFFSIFSAKGASNDFESLNYYGNKANVYSATISYSYDRGSINLSGGYNYLNSRKNANKGSDKINYNGFSLSLSKRLVSFLNEEKLKTNENYKKSLFIPSLLLGGSGELKTTEEDNFILIEDGIKRAQVVTIFTDILISPTAQFRISLPIQNNRLVSGDKMSYLGATVQYTLKFSNLN